MPKPSKQNNGEEKGKDGVRQYGNVKDEKDGGVNDNATGNDRGNIVQTHNNNNSIIEEKKWVKQLTASTTAGESVADVVHPAALSATGTGARLLNALDATNMNEQKQMILSSSTCHNENRSPDNQIERGGDGEGSKSETYQDETAAATSAATVGGGDAATTTNSSHQGSSAATPGAFPVMPTTQIGQPATTMFTVTQPSSDNDTTAGIEEGIRLTDANEYLISAQLVQPEEAYNRRMPSLIVEAVPAPNTTDVTEDGAATTGDSANKSRTKLKNEKRKRWIIAVALTFLITIVIIVVVVRRQQARASREDNGINGNDGNTTDLTSVLPSVVLNPLGSTIGDSNASNLSIGPRFGNSIAISSDGQTIAIGEPPSGGQVGKIHAFVRRREQRQEEGMWYNNADDDGRDTTGLSLLDWYPLGKGSSSEIRSASEDDSFGHAVAISANGRILACGAPDKTDTNRSPATGQRVGSVRVYQYSNGTMEGDEEAQDAGWIPLGQEIFGLDGWDQFGSSVALSDDGHTLIVSALQATKVGGNAGGYARIFQYDINQKTWIATNGLLVNGSDDGNFVIADSLHDVQHGGDDSDRYGQGISVSGNGKFVAIGAPGYANSKGIVHIFRWEEDEAVWMGAKSNNRSVIAGEEDGDMFGSSVSLSYDGSCLAVGATQKSTSSMFGYVQVYCVESINVDDNPKWKLVGNPDDMVASNPGMDFGSSISLSSSESNVVTDGRDLTVAIGAPGGGGGQLYLFRYNGRYWEQQGLVIDGLNDSKFGVSVALSDNGGIVAAGASNGSENGHVRVLQVVQASKRIRLQISHSGDNESYFQDSNTLEKRVLHYGTLASGLETMSMNEGMFPLHLLSGDALLPTVFYQAATEVPGLGEPGFGDIQMFNAMNVLGMGVSGTLLEGGVDEFASYMSIAQFPFITVNLDFTNVTLEAATPSIQYGIDGGNCKRSLGRVVKSCYYDYVDFRVGIIGHSPPNLFETIWGGKGSLSGLDFVGGSHPDTDTPIVTPSSVQILEQVDLLRREGVRIIVLLDRAGGYIADPVAIQSLYGIDVIINDNPALDFSIQANNPTSVSSPFNYVRKDAEGSLLEYPIEREDRDGGSVLVISTQRQYAYIGNLIVDYDMTGTVVGWDKERSGPIATTEEGATRLGDYIEESTGLPLEPNKAIFGIFNSLASTSTILDAFEGLGVTVFPLERPFSFFRESNLSRLIADSFLFGARELAEAAGAGGVDAAIKNIGGIRVGILGPNIIRLAVQSSLPFDNKITIVRLTLDQLLAALENGVSATVIDSARLPSLAGMKLVYDESRPKIEGLESVTSPSRIKYLAMFLDEDGIDVRVLVEDFQVVVPLDEAFTIATVNFLVGGGDQYAGLAAGDVILKTGVGEQQIVEEHIVMRLGGIVDIEDPPPSPRMERFR